jgi:hypothetical protein
MGVPFGEVVTNCDHIQEAPVSYEALFDSRFGTYLSVTL